MRPQKVTIIGAGLAGSLLAVFLARRGFQVMLYDRRPDPRTAQAERGRSINLALAARGIRALERAGVMDRVWPFTIAMHGRMVHDRDGGLALHPYGWRPGEVNYSVGRASLNRALIEAAAAHGNVTFRFGHTCLGVNLQNDTLQLREEETGRVHTVPLTPAVATDGAGSPVRASLAAAGCASVREEPLGHDYKELTIPAGERGHVIEKHALHVWPRGEFMLIALPNPDGTFTATLFLPRSGPRSFASLGGAEAVRELFTNEFPDAVPLMPDLLEEFAANPQGQLGTIHTAPWHAGGQVLLLGDAAHAIVPFHGQGMNAAFEDCVAFDELLDQHEDWETLFAAVDRLRRPNAEAIAQMALENYIEMRDTVLDPRFQRQRSLAVELERHFPDRFIPRYSMVMFHPEIPYSEALRRGHIQDAILDVLDSARGSAGVDLAQARSLIEARLEPISSAGSACSSAL